MEEIIQSQKNLTEAGQEAEQSNDAEDMDIDEATEVWIKQQKRRSIKIPKSKRKVGECFKCDECLLTFKGEEELKEHSSIHIHFSCDKCNGSFHEKLDMNKHAKTHSQTVFYNCDKCEKSFWEKDELSKHANAHSQNVLYKCDKCGKHFNEKDELSKHEETHSQDMGAKCNKCDRTYSNMNKLRRHDWRSHREIECNICGINLQSRQEISNHRKTEHQMFRRIKCRYYPDCIDEEECFFDHEDNSSSQSEENKNGQNRYCTKGEKCQNQSCEVNHMNVKNVMCRFQAKCNRSECMFKHIMERAAFLGDCTPNFRRK